MSAKEICDELLKQWRQVSNCKGMSPYPFLDSMYEMRDAMKLTNIPESDKEMICNTVKSISEDYRRLVDIKHSIFLTERGLLEPGEEYKGDW